MRKKKVFIPRFKAINGRKSTRKEGILSYKEIEQVQPERFGLVGLQPLFKM